MKPYAFYAAVSATLLLTTLPAHAQEAVWKKSYELETASKYGEALTAIDAVPANSPEAELKLIRRGWLYYLAGSYDESIREYRLAIERNSKSVDARLGVTLPLLAAKRWREAEQGAKAALTLAPNNYTGLLRLIVALEAQREWATMEKHAETLVAAYSTDATAYVYLARAKAWLGKRDAAVAAYTAVLARYPGHLEAKAYLDKK